ncbi:MAG: hypothetical protein OEM91_02430 [Hyphomicrobiales bacterium]|nr:hypothetical protein [Hyphomicrobiales bacterium]
MKSNENKRLRLVNEGQTQEAENSAYTIAPEIGGQRESAQVIERSLSSLVPLAESRDFGFLSYLLRLGLLEAKDLVARELAKAETDTPKQSAG